MTFYNQTQSCGREITFSADGSGGKFDVNLNKLLSLINKLVFTVSIDENVTMENIVSHTLNIKQNRQIVADMTLTEKNFCAEKVIIAIKIYKKNVWRFEAVASGLNGGLNDLLRAYGVSGYGILERLDSMFGRYVDNANLFALDDFKCDSNSELYSRLLNEFPQWHHEKKETDNLTSQRFAFS